MIVYVKSRWNRVHVSPFDASNEWGPFHLRISKCLRTWYCKTEPEQLWVLLLKPHYRSQLT